MTSALAAVGGMTGAIGCRAEALYASLDAAAQTEARRLFGRLVAPGDREPDTRRRARLSELSPRSRALAAQLVDARLLVADRDPATREPTIEVAHEALLTNWARLAGWIAGDRRWLLQLQHLDRGRTGMGRRWALVGRAVSRSLASMRRSRRSRSSGVRSPTSRTTSSPPGAPPETPRSLPHDAGRAGSTAS